MRIVALTFHDVLPDQKSALQPPHADEFYSIAASELDSLLSQLYKRGYRTVSSRAFRAWQQGQGTLPEKTVVFTFDDGYASNLEIAAPALNRYRFTGTFFITVERIGQSGYLTWDQLKHLVFLGMEIGSHGMTHRPLTQLPKQDLENELVHSKRRLEQQLGIPISSLAAPGGFWNDAVAKAAKEAGYDAMWVSNIGTNGKETNPSALRRVVVRKPFSLDHTVSMVEGWQPAFWWAANQQLLIRMLKRLLGVYGYERLKRHLMPNA